MLHAGLKKDGTSYLIVLTQAEFIYRIKPRKWEPEHHGFTNIWNMGSIPFTRVLSISKKVKHPKDEEDSFTIHYAAETEKNDLKVKKVKFKGDVHTCAVIRDRLKTVVNEHHPMRKYLVLVNPVSGKKRARHVFRRLVEPIFALCGVLTEVIVTENSKHATELLKTQDLSEIEGIVVVGGDGFFSECITGLLIRTQTDARLDYNDPETAISPASIPVGIIPAGSGDYIVDYLHGTRDPVTAAIRIVLGDHQKTNVAGVFQGGQLCAYSGLLMGFGLLGDIMKDMQTYRWMGEARFNIVPVRTIVRRKMLDVEVDYLTDTWQTMSHTVYGIDTYVITWRPDEAGSPDRMAPCFGDEALSVYITSKCKLADHMKQLGKVKDRMTDCWDYKFVDQLQVQGFRVRFPNTSTIMDKNGELLSNTYYLNCDGEVIDMDKPQFEVRLHRNVLSLFGDVSLKGQHRNQYIWYTKKEGTGL